MATKVIEQAYARLLARNAIFPVDDGLDENRLSHTLGPMKKLGLLEGTSMPLRRRSSRIDWVPRPRSDRLPTGDVPVTMVVLVLVATAVAAMVAALCWRLTGAATSTMATAREAGAAIRRRKGRSAALPARLDPATATGLALTLALLVIVGGGVVLGTLAYLVRADTDLLRLDTSVATWGHRHASPFSTDALNAITDLGEPMVVAGLAAALAFAETVRTRSRWVVPFLLVVVAGNGLLTTAIKHLADRVRPTLNPIAETLGPSFPSGHSSWSAAFFAAAALLLGRGRGRGVRAAIAGVAAGLALTVAGSRVLLGVHWLSDVIAGLALGSAWFAICAVAFGGRLLRFGAAASEASRVAEGRSASVARPPASPRGTPAA